MSRLVRSAWELAVAFAPALPPAALAVWLALRGEGVERVERVETTWRWLAGALALSLVITWWARGALARRLGTVASLLASLRDGDFSTRARIKAGDALLHDVLFELNALGDWLREHRLGEMEAWVLLRKVMAEIDVVVVAINEEGRIRLANHAAAAALGKPSAELLGREAAALGLAELLAGDVPRVVKDSRALGSGPWELRRGSFRLSGEPHSLVVLSDVSGALRDQEREAWKRLIRVMSHEINNSLAPICALSDNLLDLVGRPTRSADWESDLATGLGIIARRGEALSRFMTGYARLARLPAPKLGDVDVAAWVKRAVALEQRLAIAIVGGPEAHVRGDADQLDQLLINLVKNAVEATLERAPGGAVRVRWSTDDGTLELAIEDEGPGVSETANLFVPFFTTKTGGSGIGLALARQIAEAHGGEALLRTRTGGVGAEATIRLPLAEAGG
jgi:two-component system, NtrC family, nitrogen regulation sensor histidine kinase NtrY